MEVTNKPEGTTGAERRTAVQRTPAARTKEQQRAARSRAIVALIVVAAAIPSGLLGALLERRHFHAHQLVAAVNGTPIDSNQFFGRLQETSGNAVLSGIVNDELWLQFAKKQNLLPTDAEVNALYAEESSLPDFAKKLAATGQTPDSFERNLRVKLARAKVLSQGQRATDADARKFYQMNIDPKNHNALFFTPEMMSAGVILTRTEAAAQAALTELHEGVPFSTVAKKYSLDPTAAKGGLAPTIIRGRTNSKAFPGLEDSLFRLGIGDQFGPYPFAKDWLVLQCIDKKPAVTLPFDKVKLECEVGGLVFKASTARAKATLDGFNRFRKASNLQAFWPQYQDLLANRGTSNP